MNKDLHDIDELFRSGLDDYEATPSAGAKENIDAALDKQDAEKYKKRLIIWKRAALLLLLLLAGLVIYESGLIKKGGGNYTAKESAAENEKTKDVTTKTNTSGNTNGIIINQPVQQNNILPEQQNKNNIITAPDNSLITDNGITIPKNNQPDKQISLFGKKQNSIIPGISSQPDKETITAGNYDAGLQTSNHSIEALDKRISIASIAERITKSFSLLPPFMFSNLQATANIKNNTDKKKVNRFKPFWMVAPFAAYERAGYRLDSDMPNNITAIKHKEVHEPSFSIGILATRQFKKHWGLQTGLIYSNTVIGISPQKLYAFQDASGDIAFKYIISSGYAFIKPGFGAPPSFGDSITAAEGKHTINHISIPLLLKYTVGKNKLTFSPGAGIEAIFLTHTKVETEIQDAADKETVFITKLDGTKSFYPSAIIDAEIRYGLNKKISVSLRPYYRFAISPGTKNNVVETFPRSFGTSAGITIKF